MKQAIILSLILFSLGTDVKCRTALDYLTSTLQGPSNIAQVITVIME